jgi:ubiquitin-protein ligase
MNNINFPSSDKDKNKNKQDNLSLAYLQIKKELYYFLSSSVKKGFHFNLKLDEKNRKIRLFVTLLNDTDTNNTDSEIDFLILVDEEYPEKPPMVFCLSSVKSNL